MEKRQIAFPHNDAKKMKLDIPYNNFAPGCSTSNKDPFDDNTWDNEQIDEMILMASQACEVEEISHNVVANKSPNNESLRNISDYVSTFKPALTSTQMSVVCHEGTFKIPQTVMTTTQSGKVTTATTTSRTVVFDGGPSHQMQQLQTAMVKLERLKYEYAQLQDNYISKEGEVGILRSQLRSAQSQINAEKLQKSKMEERKAAECNDKINNMSKELRDMKTKMEFQDLELSKFKEKCRMLEKGSKIKLTQPPPTQTSKSNWPRFSNKMDASFMNDTVVKKSSRDKPKSADIYRCFELKVDLQKEYPLRSTIPECIYRHHSKKDIPIVYKSNREPTFVEHSSFMDIRRRILKEFKSERVQSVTKNDSTLAISRSEDIEQERLEKMVRFERLYQDLTTLEKMSQEELKSQTAVDCALKICRMGKIYLKKVLRRLQMLCKKVNPQTVMEMDEAYLAYMTNNPDTMTTRNLFQESSWCDDEQAIDARRILAVIAKICLCISSIAEYICGVCKIEMNKERSESFMDLEKDEGDLEDSSILDISLDVCKKIEYTGCSQKYPGLLSAISLLLEHCVSVIDTSKVSHLQIFNFCKCLLMLRPNGRCVVNVVQILEKLSGRQSFLLMLCKNSDNNSNMMIDYSQGVALHNSESCVIQLLCTQMEVWSSHFSRNSDTGHALLTMTKCLLNLYDAGVQHGLTWALPNPENKCSCCIRLFQSITVCLHKTAKYYLDHHQSLSDGLRRNLDGVLCLGMVIKSNMIRDRDYNLRLKDYEGHYQMFVQILSSISEHIRMESWHNEALADLKNSLVLSGEALEPELPVRGLWEDMMKGFALVD